MNNPTKVQEMFLCPKKAAFRSSQLKMPTHVLEVSESLLGFQAGGTHQQLIFLHSPISTQNYPSVTSYNGDALSLLPRIMDS